MWKGSIFEVSGSFSAWCDITLRTRSSSLMQRKEEFRLSVRKKRNNLKKSQIWYHLSALEVHTSLSHTDVFAISLLFR